MTVDQEATGTTPAMTHVFVVEPRETPIKCFYGEEPVSVFQRFVEEIELAWRSRRYVGNNDEKAWLLWSHLGETVKVELHCHDHDNRQDPESTLALLKNIYGERRTCSQLMRLFNQVEQTPGETVRAYSHRLNDAYRALTSRQRDLGLSVTEHCYLRDSFVENLGNKPVGRILREKVFDNPAVSFLEIRDAAIRWTGEEDPVPQRANRSSHLSSHVELEPTTTKAIFSDQHGSENCPLLPTGQRPRPPVYVNINKRRRGKFLCYNCRQVGHLAKNCPQVEVPRQSSYLQPLVNRSVHRPTKVKQFVQRKDRLNSERLPDLASELERLSDSLARVQRLCDNMGDSDVRDVGQQR